MPQTTSQRIAGSLDDLRSVVIRWMRRLSALWPIVALALSIVLAIVVYAADQWTNFDATALSIIFGFGAGFAGFMQRASAQKRQYTISLMSAFSTNDVIAPADHWMAEKIAKGEPIDEDQLSRKERSYLVTLLDYYEFLCILLHDEQIERRIFLDLRANALCLVREQCRDYIDTRRRLTGFDQLYCNLVEVCEGIADAAASKRNTGT